MRTHRLPKNCVALRGVIFKLGLRQVTGAIAKQGSINCFYVPGEDVFSMLSFSVPEEMYSKSVDAYLRTADNSVVVSAGPDDLPIELFDRDKRYHDFTDLEEVAELYERRLLKIVPELLSSIKYAIGSAVVTLVLFLLGKPLFPFVVVPGAISVYTSVWAFLSYRQLSSCKVYDAVGNWINVSTGETSLNGGSFSFRVRSE